MLLGEGIRGLGSGFGIGGCGALGFRAGGPAFRWKLEIDPADTTAFLQRFSGCGIQGVGHKGSKPYQVIIITKPDRLLRIHFK